MNLTLFLFTAFHLFCLIICFEVTGFMLLLWFDDNDVRLHGVMLFRFWRWFIRCLVCVAFGDQKFVTCTLYDCTTLEVVTEACTDLVGEFLFAPERAHRLVVVQRLGEVFGTFHEPAMLWLMLYSVVCCWIVIVDIVQICFIFSSLYWVVKSVLSAIQLVAAYFVSFIIEV